MTLAVVVSHSRVREKLVIFSNMITCRHANDSPLRFSFCITDTIP